MRRLLFIGLAAIVGLTLAVPFSAGARSQSPRAGAATQQPTSTTEYVVLYKSVASAAAAKAAITAAGGQVVRENTKIGLATVRSSNANFITAVAGKAGVAGAARNRVIGRVPGRGAPQRNQIETEGTKGQGGAKATAHARPGRQRQRTGHGREHDGQRAQQRDRSNRVVVELGEQAPQLRPAGQHR